MKKKPSHFSGMKLVGSTKSYKNNVTFKSDDFFSIYEPLKSFQKDINHLKIEQLLRDDRNGFMVSTVKLHDRVETLVKKHDDPDFHFVVDYFFAEYGEAESIKLGMVQHSLAVKQFISKNSTSVFFIKMLKFLRKVFL